jgi:hypothetical protein
MVFCILLFILHGQSAMKVLSMKLQIGKHTFQQDGISLRVASSRTTSRLEPISGALLLTADGFESFSSRAQSSSTGT